jgi:hypothetical protein
MNRKLQSITRHPKMADHASAGEKTHFKRLHKEAEAAYVGTVVVHVEQALYM